MSDPGPFSQVKPVRAYEAIVAQFDEAIRSGAIRPGDRLPSERELMRQFGVGRSTVREALRVLQSNGMVRSRPGDRRGPEVVAFSTELLHRPMEALLNVGQVTLYELIFFRMVTEGSLAGLAATRSGVDPDGVAQLWSLVQDLKDGAARGMQHFLKADTAFHEGVSRVAGSNFLAVQNDVVRNAARNYLATNMDTPVRRSDYMTKAIESHETLVRHIEAGRQHAATLMNHRTILAHYSVFFTDDEVARLRSFFLDPPEAAE
ncbi:FadR/GntR family transcriptional regulator [Pseudonocardia benzenivorans]|uniref:Regulatory protein GntR HTH n=2 Tax=Pseudonocardia TaxID=1847 RepID=F4CIW8_PSEUX|nr:GntR family transcriptional regulator [Pseudonocardia dioxanivorans]AEA22947.1 regulatory protein GntR HTH [Pseudonocardia dioxanivorans CB1190]GJF05049.1 GntR family transcriptional regulator [Pseudonocardia sp. D17]